MSSPASPPAAQPGTTPASEASATQERRPQPNPSTALRKISYKRPVVRTIEDFDCDQMKIGEGTYGKVFKAHDKQTGQMVALKQIQITQENQGLPITSVREIKLLKSLHHENIVKLIEVVLDAPSKWGKEGEHIYLVFEFMDHDLTGLSGQQGSSFVPGQIRCYAQQMLEGLYICHKKGILHRDIKGANMLVNNNGVLKLADFGLARRMTDDARTPNVVTLWYRAPELLLGTKKYDGAIDMWSVGCLLVELYLRQPLFPGQSESDQLSRIFELCGTPSHDNWPEGLNLPNYRDFTPRQQRRRMLRSRLGNIEEHALDLIDQLLSLDPAKRPTAEKALDHPYFFQEPRLSPSQLPKYAGSFNELYHKSAARARESRPSEQQQPFAKKYRDNQGHAHFRAHPHNREHHRLSDNGPRSYRGNSSGRPYGHHGGGYRQYRQGSGNPEYVPPRNFRRNPDTNPDRTRERRDDPPPRPLHQREVTTHVEPPKDYREQGLTSEGFSKERK